MNYKKIIKSRRFRFLILRLLLFIPDKMMISIQYYIKLGRAINWKNPQRYTEKIQKYKLVYRNEILGQCVDKYEVRKYILGKGLGGILNDLYGVYDRAEEIDFENLPQKFVIKTTDGGGGNTIIICTDKKALDIKSTIKRVNSWLNAKEVNAGREWAYTKIQKSRIVVEKFLENYNNPEAGIEDFKILCFHGKPEYVIVDTDRYIGHKRDFYDLNWNKLNIKSDCMQLEDEYPKPTNLSQMLEVAKVLSEDFPAVRVDLYNVSGKIIFGELTFYPWSGYVQFDPDEFDYELGEKFKI